MYPFSEFDLPDEMKPIGQKIERPGGRTALVPRWLRNPMDALLPRRRATEVDDRKEMAEKAECC